MRGIIGAGMAMAAFAASGALRPHPTPEQEWRLPGRDTPTGMTGPVTDTTPETKRAKRRRLARERGEG